MHFSWPKSNVKKFVCHTVADDCIRVGFIVRFRCRLPSFGYFYYSTMNRYASLTLCGSVVFAALYVIIAFDLYSRNSGLFRRRGLNFFERKTPLVDCTAVIEGRPDTLEAAERYTRAHPRQAPPDEDLRRKAQDCVRFKSEMGYGVLPVAKEELDFPVAFSILVHKHAAQLERLLRIVHRPHNYYCIHVDANSSDDVFQAVRAVSRCFTNVFLPSERVGITYAHFTRLQADLSCMRELVVRGKGWRYLINLTGQMYPLKTNLEIVKILKTFRGFNDIDSLPIGDSLMLVNRYMYKWKIANNRLAKSRETNPIPPYNVTVAKGVAYGAFTREFLEHVLSDVKVQAFLNWTRDTYSPDEFFWATVGNQAINPQLQSPGALQLPPGTSPFLSTHVQWVHSRRNCGGKYVRGICIFGVSDLQDIVWNNALFVNKFHADYQYLALDCIEELIWNRTFRPLPMDLRYYTSLRRNHGLVNLNRTK